MTTTMRLFQSPWVYSIGSHANNSRDLKMFRFDQHQLVSSPNNKKGAWAPSLSCPRAYGGLSATCEFDPIGRKLFGQFG